MPEIMENGETREIEYPELQTKLRNWLTGGQHWLLSAFASDTVAMALIGKLTTDHACDDGQIALASIQAGAVKEENEVDDPNAKLMALPPIAVAVFAKDYLRAGELIRAGKKFGLDLATSVASGLPIALVFAEGTKQGERRMHWLAAVLDEITTNEQLKTGTISGAEASKSIKSFLGDSPMAQQGVFSVPTAEAAEAVAEFMAAGSAVKGGKVIAREESCKLICKLIDSKQYWIMVTASCDKKAVGAVDSVLKTLPAKSDWHSCTLTGLRLRLVFISQLLIRKAKIIEILNSNEALDISESMRNHTGDIFVMGDDRHPPEKLQLALEYIYSVTKREKSDPPTPKPPSFDHPEHN